LFPFWCLYGTKLQVWRQLTVHCLVLNKGYRFFSSLKRPDWLWKSRILLLKRHRRLFLYGKAIGACNWPLNFI
jgi:hypothetical protein